MNEIVKLDEEATGGLPALAGNQSLAISLARAEVDQQITTAHAFPRSIAKAVRNITTLATLDEESAEECIYALPRGGKPIKGPSVRLAEIVASQWQNCRVGARVVHVDRVEKFVEAEGVFHDLETNTATTARVRRRISDKNNRLFNDDMIVVTGNAACAIAKRNAILGGVPKAIWRKAYAEVEHVLAGDVKTLSDRRDRAFKAFAAFGVTPEQIFEALAIGGVDDIGLDHMSTLTAMHATLKNGESTVEEMFPKTPAKGSAPKGLAAKLDALAGGPTEIHAEIDKKNDERAVDPETGEIVEEGVRIVSEEIGSNASETSVIGRESAAEEISPADAPVDPKLDTLLAAARAVARQGCKKLTVHLGRLDAPGYLLLEPHFDDLRKIATDADAGRD